MDIYIDILTAPQYQSFEELSDKKPVSAKIWDSKFGKDNYIKQAGFYSEFNRIVAIGYGRVTSLSISVKSTKAELIDGFLDEKIVLEEFIKVLSHRNESEQLTFNRFAGLSVASFDIPLLIKKCMQYKLLLPNQLEILKACKPWNMPIVEISKLYNGDISHGGAFDGNIDVLSEMFGLPTVGYCAEEVVSMVNLDGNHKIAKDYVEQNVHNIIELHKILSRTV